MQKIINHGIFGTEFRENSVLSNFEGFEMSIPSATEILEGLAPSKSVSAYKRYWMDFQMFLQKGLSRVDEDNFNLDIDDKDDEEVEKEQEPKEEDYVRYFYYLKNTRKFKASSLWSIYSRLNNCHQRKFGSRLQQWPRITLQLKKYESGYIRKKAKVFTKDQIFAGLQLNLTTPYWILRKAAICLAYCGGLRGIELRSLKVGSLHEDVEGVWVHYQQSKQKGEEKENRYLVPFNRNSPHLCMASRVLEYLRLLIESVPTISDDSDLFHQCTKDGYGRQSMGKNLLAKFGREFAEKLDLSDPEEYTGHCFRRSSATEAANKGATTVDLKRHFGWVQEGTALKYLDDTKERARKMAKLLTGSGEENQDTNILQQRYQNATSSGTSTHTAGSFTATQVAQSSVSAQMGSGLLNSEQVTQTTSVRVGQSREPQDGKVYNIFNITGGSAVLNFHQ